jgi:hypothetical protein
MRLDRWQADRGEWASSFAEEFSLGEQRFLMGFV